MTNRTANPCTPVRFRARPRLFKAKPAHEAQAQRSAAVTYPGTALEQKFRRVPGGYCVVAYVISPDGEPVELGQYRAASKAAAESLMLADSTLLLRWRRAERGWAKEREAEQAKRTEEVRQRRLAWFKRRRASDPTFRLVTNMRGAIYQSVKGVKSRRWLVMDYTPEELRAHLEARFTEGMTWENYGKWHIDHIRPLASFVITGPDCPEFKAAWALSNLQPLWAVDNMSKGARAPAPPEAEEQT